MYERFKDIYKLSDEAIYLFTLVNIEENKMLGRFSVCSDLLVP